MLHQTNQNFLSIGPDLEEDLPRNFSSLILILLDFKSTRTFKSEDFYFLYVDLLTVIWPIAIDLPSSKADSMPMTPNGKYIDDVKKHTNDVFIQDEGCRGRIFWCINQPVQWHRVGIVKPMSLQTYGPLICSRNYPVDKFCRSQAEPLALHLGNSVISFTSHWEKKNSIVAPTTTIQTSSNLSITWIIGLLGRKRSRQLGWPTWTRWDIATLLRFLVKL